MADISLRDYLAQLDTLLEKGASDEVIHHCRHILRYFPKNAETYRCLGRALVYAGTWDKAGEVFRRLLSVYPDDYTAHAGLSDVYLSLKRPDDAIWHLERAFEQDPNNQAVIDSLRDLYRKHRLVDQAKLQLTVGAVARQYLRNGLYEQAIDTLQQALARTSDRVDLRLLLARTYNEAGYKVEAGETALEVLRALPDCVDANRILTELWLSEQRPSDAQRYLNRIQSVDPYLALELAQGQPAASDKFRLEELDYRRSAQREIVSRTPDWLQEIEPSAELPMTSFEDDLADWMGSVAATPAAESSPTEFNDDLFSSELPSDWLTTPAESEPAAAPSPKPKRTGFTGLLSSLNLPEDTTPEPSAEVESLDLDLFPELPADASAEAEVPSEFLTLFEEEPLPEPEPELPAAQQSDDDDPLAWLHGSGIELVEDEPQATLFDDDEEVAPVQEAEVDPLAWLHGYGGELLIDEEPSAAIVEDNPLPVINEPTMETVKISRSPVPPASSNQEADPLDWLADDALLEEALNLEALTDAPVSAEAAEQDEVVWANDALLASERQEVMAEENPFDWLNSQNEEQPSEAQPSLENPLSQSDWFADLTPASDEPDWLQPPAAELPATDNSELEWLTGEPEAKETASGALEWLAAAENDETVPGEDVPDWLAAAQPPAAEPASATEFAWMSADEPETTDEEPAASGTGFEWLSAAEDEEAAAEAEPAAGLPDWLSQAQPPAAEPASATEFAWMSASEPEEDAEEPPVAASGEAFEWLSAADDEEEAEAEPVAGMPDWLSQVQPPTLAPAAADEPLAWMSANEPEAEEPVASGTGFEWLSAADDDAEEAEAEPVAGMPDWLSQVQPPTLAPAAADEPLAWMSASELEEEAEEPPVAASGEAFEWLSAADDEAEEAEVEPAAELPDWLSQVQPPAAELATADEPLAWMSVDEPEPEAEEPPVAASGEAFEWLSAADDEEEAEAEPAAGMPDWLSQVQPPAAEPTGVTEFSWMSADEPDDTDEEPAASGEAFEWLSGADDEEEAEVEPAAGMPDWLSQVQPPATTESVEAEDDEFAWISSIEADEDAAEAAPLSEARETNEGTYAWFADDEDAEAAAGEPAAMPDWLAEVPSSDQDADESLGAVAKEFAWMSALEDDEAEVEPATPAPSSWLEEQEVQEDASQFDWGEETDAEAVATSASDIPDWLSGIRPSTESEVEPAAVGNEFNWIDDINASEAGQEDEEPVTFAAATGESEGEFEFEQETAYEEELAPIPARNAPDWLNAMVPGLDVDYAAEEDEPIEQSYVSEADAALLSANLPAAKPTRKEFDWLVEIVDEETREMSLPPAEKKRGRFTFSRRPAWLRQPIEQRDEPAAEPHNDDSDLPPWLR